MSEQQSDNLDEIEGLLASRQQLMGWLDKLEEAGARAPEPVRAKVGADYRARVAQVVAQLATHADLIGSALAGLRAQTRELRQLRREEEEVRAEAELRHAVGEYSDDEWQLVELESSGKITEFDHELERLSGEAGRLEEVQGLIVVQEVRESGSQGSREPEVAEMAEHGAQTPELTSFQIEEQPTLTLLREPEPELPAAPPPRPEAPRFTPRAGAPKPRESGPARSAPLTPAHAPTPAAPQDELAFLRSVTLDPSTTRLTPQATGTVNSMDREERPSQGAVRTLKCAECGSLNRPTEWYCERCGAELAAL